jgi:hypothetical protein
MIVKRITPEEVLRMKNIRATDIILQNATLYVGNRLNRAHPGTHYLEEEGDGEAFHLFERNQGLAGLMPFLMGKAADKKLVTARNLLGDNKLYVHVNNVRLIQACYEVSDITEGRVRTVMSIPSL